MPPEIVAVDDEPELMFHCGVIVRLAPGVRPVMSRVRVAARRPPAAVRELNALAVIVVAPDARHVTWQVEVEVFVFSVLAEIDTRTMPDGAR